MALCAIEGVERGTMIVDEFVIVLVNVVVEDTADLCNIAPCVKGTPLTTNGGVVEGVILIGVEYPEVEVFCARECDMGILEGDVEAVRLPNSEVGDVNSKSSFRAIGLVCAR